MTRLLAINGSYREDGAIDQAVDLALQTAIERGMTTGAVHLRDFPIGFCRNCRHCTQVPGESPGACVQQDRMRELIEMIEAADVYVLASPTNFYSATALFKRFMERLIVYSYWPWGARAPVLRKKASSKRAIVIASSAAPGLMGHLFYGTMKQLKMTAATIGARPVDSLFIGLMSQQEHPALPDKVRLRIQRMIHSLGEQ